jgi:hypothetical protein
VSEQRKGKEQAERGRRRKKSERKRPLRGAEEISDDRVGGRHARCFARPKEEAGQRELPDIAHYAVECRHDTPERKPNRDDVAAIPAIGERSDRQRGRRVEGGENESGEKSDCGVREAQIRLDLENKKAEQVPVNVLSE